MSNDRGRQQARERRWAVQGEDIWIPRSKRWKVHWTPTDLQEYARQMDYFAIQLAVAERGKPLLDYVSNVSQPRPDSRQGAGAAEKRLCMTWNGKGGKLYVETQEFRQAPR